MDLRSIGQFIAERRRAKGLTLHELAAQARVGRSTLAALETGKLAELGLNKVARICAALDLVLDVRPPQLDAPLMAHRHLTETAGRELTKAAIDDVITRGDIEAWRGLARVGSSCARRQDGPRGPPCARGCCGIERTRPEGPCLCDAPPEAVAERAARRP